MNGSLVTEMPVMEIAGLVKSFRPLFRQEICAVRDVSLQVRQGQVVAFIGPNGAGKTTTIYVLLGLLRPDQGRVSLFGQPAGSLEARRRTGFQSEIFNTYGFKTAEGVLDFYGRLSGMSPAEIATRGQQLLSRLGLAAASTRKVRGYSKGMMQRLGLAQAMLHQPELLILDEPTTGLDPEGRKLVADIILEEKSRGTTIFLSSHILADVERTRDHVIIISQGRIVFSESMAQLHHSAGEWEIEVLDWTPAAREAATGAEIVDGRANVSVVRCAMADKDALLHRLISAGASIGGVRQRQALEDIYMKYAGGTSHG